MEPVMPKPEMSLFAPEEYREIIKECEQIVGTKNLTNISRL
jgi:hypothetical protein